MAAGSRVSMHSFAVDLAAKLQSSFAAHLSFTGGFDPESTIGKAGSRMARGSVVPIKISQGARERGLVFLLTPFPHEGL